MFSFSYVVFAGHAHAAALSYSLTSIIQLFWTNIHCAVCEAQRLLGEYEMLIEKKKKKERKSKTHSEVCLIHQPAPAAHRHVNTTMLPEIETSPLNYRQHETAS